MVQGRSSTRTWTVRDRSTTRTWKVWGRSTTTTSQTTRDGRVMSLLLARHTDTVDLGGVTWLPLL
jgi:hypothetical protein